MKIITGDEFGILRLINTKTKNIIDKYGKIKFDNEIINIIKNENTNYDNLQLFITNKKENFLLDWYSKKILSIYKNNNDNIFTSSIYKNNNNINNIFCSNLSGSILNIQYSQETNEILSNQELKIFDINENPYLKIKLNKIVNSFNENNFYLLYQNKTLLSYDLIKNKIDFTAKNLPNDELSLKIPIYDSDLIEIQNNTRSFYVSTGYGEIRMYDKKASSKPILNSKIFKNKINKITLCKNNNYLIVGDTKGNCHMLDIRKNFNICKNFKGNNGSIRIVLNCQEYNSAVIGGFDRYIKWYDYENNINEQVFVKNRLTSGIIVDIEEKMEIEENEIENEEIDESEILDSEEEEEEKEEKEKEKSNKKQKNIIKNQFEDELKKLEKEERDENENDDYKNEEEENDKYNIDEEEEFEDGENFED
jgi:hypothetical protein